MLFFAFRNAAKPLSSKTNRLRSTIALVALVLLAACFSGGVAQEKRPSREYFDGHNHNSSGILPYYAYADLAAFIVNPTDPSKVDLEHRRQLWAFLANYQYQGSRYSPGALATVQLYGKDPNKLSAAQVNGALERVLTTTPWTDFDSAYAFRGAPIYSFLTGVYKDDARLNKDVCDATILELAVTHTGYSEQFIFFVGGWGPSPSPSSRLENIRCFMKEPGVLAAAGKFKALGVSEPKIKSLIMTNTSDLGSVTRDGQDWIQYGSTGQCAPTKPVLRIAPEDIRNGLLGRDSDGAGVIAPDEERAFFDEVVGIDTAGPEITCFTDASDNVNKGAGMDNYKRLVRAVYSASRERRGAGWHGKLLIHTHVGEGGIRYSYDAGDVFSTFPGIQIDPATGVAVHIEQARENVRRLIQTVRELKTEIKDIDDFVIFRFGHVTHADKQEALAMKELGIEADINLESNIATRAYWTKALAKPAPEPLNEQQQLEYNDLVAKVLNSGHAAETLADHSLKYMLEAGVRTVLGSDGGGEEHSDIAREYQLFGELIEYWRAHDAEFKNAKDVSVKTIDRNVEEHLKDMRADKKVR